MSYFYYDLRLMEKYANQLGKTDDAARWGKLLLKRARAAAGSARTRQWFRRLSHPGEAEIPIRARAAQIYGIAGDRLRTAQSVTPLGGTPVDLADGIGIVVPSRNGRELLANMLPALLPQVGRGEVIVSDNGSTDGTAEWLAQNYPEVRVLQNSAPLSFSTAGATRRPVRFDDLAACCNYLQARGLTSPRRPTRRPARMYGGAF